MLRQLRRQALVAGLTLLVVALVLAVRPSTAATVAAPAAGGVYVEGVVGRPTYLNPLLSSLNPADADVVALTFRGLTRLAPDGSVQPDLAQSWSVSPDGKVYTFHLGSNTWSDGQPVTADDVVYTVQAIQSPGFPGDPQIARLWQDVKVQKIDAATVQFTLPAPYAPFVQDTTQPLAPAHLLRGVFGKALTTSTFNVQPVGTGPFVVRSASLQAVSLVPNPHFPGPPPYLAGITLRYFNSYADAEAALRGGEIQGLGGIPPADVLGLASDRQLSVLQQTDDALLSLLILNTDAAPFTDARVRQALDLAIDRSQVIQAGVEGEGVPAAGPIPPSSWAFAAQAGAYTYDPQRAASLLDQAGWTEPSAGAVRTRAGQPLQFALLAVNEPDRLRVAQTISQELRAVGIQADVQTAGWSGIVQDFLAPRRFQAVLTEVYSPTGDPDPYPFWDSSQIKGGLNVAGWSDPTADRLLAEGRVQSTEAARRQDYAQFQARFAQQQPSILLYYPIYAYAVPATLQGVQPGLFLQPADRFQSVTGWYLRTQAAAAGTEMRTPVAAR